ncbi:MAG TPA: ABC transporter substrate-binding protein [Pirellulales bacterium]|nr:ABC transporter substrate-binding protein [Pirellulales bacterium]
MIGLLQIGTPSGYDLSGFRQGLKDAGYVEGQNLAIEYRFANDDPSRLSELASDLVRRQVRVIAAVASGLAARAAKDATNTIPIVFGYGADPIKQGLVANLNRPGGNVTGIISLANELYGKQLGILHELLPQAAHFAVLANPKGTSIYESIVKNSQAAASAIGQTIEILNASTDGEIDAVFMRLGDEKSAQGLLVTNDPFYIARRVQLAILAARYAVPAIYPFREMAEVGGLLSYGPNLAERDRQTGLYVGRILKGEKPADLPVQQMSKFELVINLKTAKALGLSVPNSMQLLADAVIE